MFLINSAAIRFAQDDFHIRDKIGRVFLAQFDLSEFRDGIHWPGSVRSIHQDNVIDIMRFEIDKSLFDAIAFKLEHAIRVVLCIDVLNDSSIISAFQGCQTDLFLLRFANVDDGSSQDIQGRQSEKIHLQKSQSRLTFHHIAFDNPAVLLIVPEQWCIIRNRPVSNDDAGSMNPRLNRDSFHELCFFQQFFGPGVLAAVTKQFRVIRFGFGQSHLGRFGNQFSQPVADLIRYICHPGNGSDCRPWRQYTFRDNIADSAAEFFTRVRFLITVLIGNIVNDLGAD